jgi:hypothetical protein
LATETEDDQCWAKGDQNLAENTDESFE